MDPEEIRYKVLRAIDQVQRQYPSNFVNDEQIVEITGLDLRTVWDELDLLEAHRYTREANSHSGKSAMLEARGRRLLEQLVTERARPPSTQELRRRILEYLAAREDDEGRQAITDLIIAREIGVTLQCTQDHLRMLQDDGFAELTSIHSSFA